MVNRIVGVIGWVGTALVFGAVADPFPPAGVDAVRAPGAAWAGLVCILIYMVGQWRDVVSFYGRRQARYGTMSIVGILVGARHRRRRQLPRRPAEQALGPHREPGLQPVRSDRSRSCTGLDAPVKFTVYDQETNFDRFRDRLDEYAYESEQGHVEYVDLDRQPARAKARRGAGLRHDRHRVQGQGRARLEHRGAGHHQRADQGGDRRSSRRSTSRRATARRTRRARIASGTRR